MLTMTLIPSGIIHSPHRQATGTPVQAALATGVRGTVEVLPEYAAGLRDLDGFERIWLVYWFDRAKPAQLVVMIERTRQRAAAAGAWNVLYMVGDVFADGFGGDVGSKDACLLFNILHCEEPVRLLAEAARVVRPGGAVLVIHWRYDPATPRGPSLEIRPRPEQIAGWARETGLLEVEGPATDLPPWHYGIRFHRQS